VNVSSLHYGRSISVVEIVLYPDGLKLFVEKVLLFCIVPPFLWKVGVNTYDDGIHTYELLLIVDVYVLFARLYEWLAVNGVCLK